MGVQDHEPFYAAVRHMTDEQLFALFRTINSAQILAIVSVATGTLALREYIVYLGAEWRTWKLLFKRRVLPARVAIIATRYGYLGAFISAVIFQLGKPKAESCLAIYRAVYGLYVVLWASAGSIFLMRLSIIYAREPKVMIFFTALWLLCMSLWSYVVTLFTATPVPKTLLYPYGPTCMTGLVPRKSAIAWAGSIVFDSAVFIATLIRFRNASNAKEPSVQMRSRKWLFESSMFYFGASLVFNTALMLSSLLVDDPVLSNLGTGCAFAVHAIMASRMVYEAKGWSRDDTEDEDGMILNTYNERKKNGGGDGCGGVAGITSRIAYSVEETIVRSEGIGGGSESANESGHNNASYDMEARREQRRNRHFKNRNPNKQSERFPNDGNAEAEGEHDDKQDAKHDIDRNSRRSVNSVQQRINGVRGKYFGSSATRTPSTRRTSITHGDGESVDRQHANATIASRRGRETSILSPTNDPQNAVALSGGEELHREPTYKASNKTLTESWDGMFGGGEKVRIAASSGSMHNSSPFDAETPNATALLTFTPRSAPHDNTSKPQPPTPAKMLNDDVLQLPATPLSAGPPSYSTTAPSP